LEHPLTGLAPKERGAFCLGPRFAALAQLTPQIMNHETLMSLRYDPFLITEKVRKEASEEHRQFANAFQRYSANPQDENLQTALLKKVEQVLFVVRCNIAHSEKTPKGPDMDKTKRDRDVSDLAAAAIEDFFELLFDHPTHRLAVYGTLAPGEPNHSVLSDLSGTWQEGLVQGNLTDQDGLRSFRWTLGAEKTKVNVFSSNDLESSFPKLDRFEEKRYHRILVPVETPLGILIANIYEGVL
jgi:gamma-glutamylcyclotransferase (GGCT)/AIG2-like uncharacterized protein YtfP